MTDDDPIEMTFTRTEWKLIAIGLMTLKPEAITGGAIVLPKARQLAIVIAQKAQS